MISTAIDTTTLMTGAALGIGASLTPGPISMMILRESMTAGLKTGMRVAITPAITDVPIVLMAMVLCTQIAKLHWALALISFCGAAFLFLLARKNFTTKISDLKAPEREFKMREALIAGILSPQPYIFWLTIGAPLALAALQISFLNAVLFVLGLYTALVLTNLLFALAVSHSTKFISGRPYAYILKGSSLALFFFAIMFLIEGIKHI